MQAFTTFTGTVIPLNMHDVDTDMIIPAQYLTQIDRNGYGKYLFANLKANDPNFVFNHNCYQNAAILLTRTDFGCGSSREHAVWAIQQAGIKVIIAESYSDIFFNNATKNGLLLITLPEQDIKALLAINPLELTINLEKQTIIAKDNVFEFDYDPFRKTCLLNGYDDLDYLLSHLDQIDRYKEKTA